MICSVCKGKVGKCENGGCGIAIRDRFYCFGGIHFCSRTCWKVWFLSGEEKRLILAKKQKPRKIKPIEVIGEIPKGKETIMYGLRCANCGVSPEFAGKIITGGYMERGEWVCSDSCYKTFEEKAHPHMRE